MAVMVIYIIANIHFVFYLMTTLVWTFFSFPIKGILHPKMKTLSSFTHPQVVANLYEFLSSEERLEPNSYGALLTSIVFFFLLWKSMVPYMCVCIFGMRVLCMHITCIII